MIYRDTNVIIRFTDLLNHFSNSLQNNIDFVKIPEDKWLIIELYSSWKTRLKGKAKVYFLGLNNKKIVKKVFNNLIYQNKLKKTRFLILFAFLIFVIQKTLPRNKTKTCIIIDTRELNEKVIIDTYFMLSQKDILKTIQGCKYIIIIDFIAFFFQ